MVDKVKPLKLEKTPGGTELDLDPTESDPTEDYVATKGIAFENSDNTTVYGDSGVMKFKDTVITTPVTLNDLLAGVAGIKGRGGITLFVSDQNGENVNSGVYQTMSTKKLAGPDLFPNGTTFSFTVAALASSGGSVTFRLYDLTNVESLGEITFTETSVTVKSISISPNNGSNLMEVQAKNTGGAGRLFSSSVDTAW